MNQIMEDIAEKAREVFEEQTAIRDHALAQARIIIRYAANAIRATHRAEVQKAEASLSQAKELAKILKQDLLNYPQIYYAGYTQDALKEYVEAAVTLSLIFNLTLPTPESLDVGYGTYLQGLAEANGELRRRCLDILRHGYSKEAEDILSTMDDIYALLITMDYPDAVTGGLRRLTDIARGINERTRGELTIILRESHLEDKLTHFEKLIQDGYTSK